MNHPHLPPRAAPTGPPRWFWGVLIAIAGVAAVGVAGLAAWWFLVPWEDDEYADDGYIDDPAVAEVITDRCVAVEEASDELALFVGPAAGAASLRTLASAIAAMADGIDDAREPSDSDSEQLAADWRFLEEQIAEAADLAEGGRPVTVSMERGQKDVPESIYVNNDECYVPLRVQALDPDYQPSWLE